MASPVTQLGRSAARERVLEVIRGLLEELGSQGALPMLNFSSQLDRDLGLGSLERVELLARLETAFGVRLPDRIASEANTPEDLARAILAGPVAIGEDAEPDSALRAAVTVQKLHREAADAGVFSAETLIDVLRYRATHNAEQTHLFITEDGEAGERSVTMTFGELYAAGQRCAAELARRGVPAGARVALMLPTSRAFFVSYAGILLAGAIPVPIYPPFRADRIEEYAARQSAILNNAEVCLLLTFRRAEAVAKLLRPRVRSLTEVADAEKLMEAADKAPPPSPGALPLHLTGSRARKGSDIALLQYTSGSTGDPKGVVLTHANLLANMRAVGEAVKLGPGDVGVSWLPLYHDMGLIGAWLTLLHFGIPLAVISPLAFLTRPERWLQAFHKHRGTISAAPNFAYELCVRKIADKDIQGVDLSPWRAALNGAEPVNPETLERFANRFASYGFRREAQLPVYGLAEAALGVTIPPLNRGPLVDRVERETFTAQGRAVPTTPLDDTAISFVSSGKPLPRHEVRVVDKSGTEVADRTEGFLWLRGPSATSGYYRDPKATEALLPLGQATGEGEYAWVNSGDRAYRADGEIYVTGRVKDIIIKSGRNLYPHEIEELAGRVEGVRKGCVVAFGVTDPITGTERLVIVAELRERAAAKESELRAHVTQAITEAVLAALGIPPDVVELVPPHSIPKTSSGKLRREETKRLYRTGALAARTPPTWLQVAKLAAASGVAGVGQWLRRGLDLAYGVYATVVFGGWIVPTWLLVLVTPSRRLSAWLTSNALKVYMALVGCRIRVQGREHLRDAQARVFVSNHTSYFDVLVLMAALGVNYRFVSKMEVRSMPFIGTFLRKLGHVWFDRSDPQARLRQAAEIEQLLRDGESVFVFPEGTFTPQSGVRPFRLGAFKAAVTTCRPICPVALCGTRQFLRDQTYLPRPSSVTVTICPPLEPARNTSPSDWHEMVRLRDAARAAIAQHCGEQIL